ncbi:hypothetical protein MBANPS3_010776 [Mucor bainieri]
MVPSVENRRKATDMMDSTALDITYTEDQGPKHPFAMGKSIIAKNPFTYKTYPRTPPASPILHPKMPPVIPTLSPATLPSNPSASVVPSGEEVSGSSNSYGFSNSDDAAYTPENILCVVKSLYFKRVENEELFDYGVYSTTDIYYHVARQFLPRLPDFIYEEICWQKDDVRANAVQAEEPSVALESKAAFFFQ